MRCVSDGPHVELILIGSDFHRHIVVLSGIVFFILICEITHACIFLAMTRLTDFKGLKQNDSSCIEG